MKAYVKTFNVLKNKETAHVRLPLFFACLKACLLAGSRYTS